MRWLALVLLLATCAPPAEPNDAPPIPFPEAKPTPPTAKPLVIMPPSNITPKCRTCWTLSTTAANGNVTTREGLTKKRCETLRDRELRKPHLLEAAGLAIVPAGANILTAECR